MFEEEINLIIDKNLIDKAVEIMKQVNEPKHSLSHIESVVKYTIIK